MFVYAYRISDRYACEIVSRAVPAETSPGWCPSNFEIGRWGSRIGIEFPPLPHTHGAQGKGADTE